MKVTKNLVVGVVGDNSLHKNWVGKKKIFDLMLIYFGKNKKKYKKECDYWIENTQGTKWNIIFNLNKNIKNIIEQYDYIFFPDDDITISCYKINYMFQIMKSYDLLICQPSIKGFVSDVFTKKIKNNKLRFTNWVEIMCPCFSLLALKKCWKTFRYNKTNWGIAHLWNLKLDLPKNKIAILDCITAEHTRKTGSGENYKNNFNKNFAIQELKSTQQMIEILYNINSKKINYKKIPYKCFI